MIRKPGLLVFFLVTSFLFANSIVSVRAETPSLDQSYQFANSLSQAFEHVASVIKPSVVNISAVTRAKQLSSNPHQNPFFNSPFRDFFNDDFMERFRSPFGDRHAQQGMGTGVIISEKGYILTNSHVVGQADEISVRLWDKRVLDAKLIGSDPKTDLAVIKIDARDLTPAKLGDSSNLKIGEWVVAAGNPFGLDNTITQGIVSAKGRSNVGIVDYEDFIQTDAAINPGNSGGPLVNLRGEVVGINAAIFSKSGGYMGIGFAIPINMAKTIMHSLIDKGKVVRGWLGVAIQDLDENLAKSFDYKGTEGALVGDVTPGTPAADGGIEQGDIIVKYNDKPIKNVNQLRNMVAATEPGTKVKIRVIRAGSSKNLKVKIGELKSKTVAQQESEPTFELGLAVQDITPEIAQKLDLVDQKGVIVNAIQPGSVAQRSGLKVRDVVLQVDGRAVKGVSHFRKLLKSKDLSKGIRLTVQSGDFQRFVFLKSR